MPRDQHKLDLQPGLPETLRPAAAALYYEAFLPKLRPLLGTAERAVPLLAQHLNPACTLTAVYGDALAGVAGLHLDGQAFVQLGLRALQQAYGWVSGTARGVVGVVFSRSPQPGELLMDGLAVAAQWRGQGVGTQLLSAVLALARQRGYERIRLDVVDSNPRARQLYERLGFVPVQTTPTPYLRRWFGFSAYTTLVRPVTTP